MGSHLEIAYGPSPRANAVPRRAADIRRARSLLGFSPLVDLDEGLRRTAAWWRRESPTPARVTT
jgi:UDP-glucose 4-epimerase